MLAQIIQDCQNFLNSLGHWTEICFIVFAGFLISFIVLICMTIASAILWHRFHKLPAQVWAREEEERYESVLASVPKTERACVQPPNSTVLLLTQEEYKTPLQEEEFRHWDAAMRGKDEACE